MRKSKGHEGIRLSQRQERTLVSVCGLSGGYWFWRSRWRRIAFDVVVVPGKVALEAVLDVRRRFEFVILAWIDHKLGGSTQAFKSLVHLLPAQNRNVRINLPAHKQRRRGDVLHAIERRDSLPNGFALPRMPKFGLIVALVLVVTIHARKECSSRSRDRRFKAIGLCNYEVGGDAAVGPAADGKLCRIRNALLDGVIHHSHVVLKILVAPVSPNGLGVLLAIARRAARVGKKNHVTVRGIKLRQVVKLRVIGPDWAAVRAKNRGVLLSRNVVNGLVQVAGDRRAVLAFELNVLAVRKFELAKESIIRMSDLGESAGGNRKQLVRTVDCGDLRDNFARFGQREVVDHEAATNATRDFTPGRWNAAQILRAVVVGNEVNEFAIGRKTRYRSHAIQSKRQDFGRSPGGRRNRNVPRGVIE